LKDLIEAVPRQLFEHQTEDDETDTRVHDLFARLELEGDPLEDPGRVFAPAVGQAIERKPGGEARGVGQEAVDVEVGDLLMLCSDGLTEMVGTYEIAGLLSIGEDDVHESARRLVDLANEAGGRDNISVIVIEVLARNG